VGGARGAGPQRGAGEKSSWARGRKGRARPGGELG
jgi:hypothetical protein